MERRRMRTVSAAIALVTLLTAGMGCSSTVASPNSTAEAGDDRAQFQDSNISSNEWRQMTESEVDTAWDSILNNPLGIAGLNQLAIEGFIGPDCEKSFYLHELYGLAQFMLRVRCADERGVSAALGYDEMRIVYNRFEFNIESFDVERVHEENRQDVTPLPTN